MRPRFEPHDGGQGEPDAIRSGIAHTRDAMDRTLEEISSRITPRHLLDEFLDLLRSHGPDRATVREKSGIAARKASDTASEIGQAVANVVKQHPIPTLLVGAGIAWGFYERQREENKSNEGEEDMDYETDVAEKQSRVAEEARDQMQAGAESAKDQLKSARDTVQEKASETGKRIKGKAREMRQRAGQMRERVGAGAQRTYEAGRERFNEARQAHPLSTGLGFLAIGLLAGLAVPETRAEDRVMGRASDRLKDRVKEQGKEYMERGKQVVSSTASTIKEEAQKQGLTPQGMTEKVKEVASQAKEAANSAAEGEASKPGEPASPGTGPNQPA